MAAEWRYRGRIVTAAEIVFIRQLIAAHPGASRRKLSSILCAAWDWKQPNGAPRDMVCRGMLLMLDRGGEIVLPPMRSRPLNPLLLPCPPEPVGPDNRPVRGGLHALLPLGICA